MQINDFPHDRFEGRDPRCTLTVFIDDTTGKWMALRLVAAETTQAYMQTLRAYLSRHGRPVALPHDAKTVGQSRRRHLELV